MRDAEELHDALLTLGVLPEESPWAATWAEWFASLVADDRAARLRTPEGAVFWVGRSGRRSRGAAYPDARFEPAVAAKGDAPDEEEAVAALVRGRAECSGPFTVGDMAGWLSLRESGVAIALARLEGEGMLLRGRFTPGRAVEEMCDRRILARIHRATISRLRREIEPVPVALFLRFLFRWQHVDPGLGCRGTGGCWRSSTSYRGTRRRRARGRRSSCPLGWRTTTR